MPCVLNEFEQEGTFLALAFTHRKRSAFTFPFSHMMVPFHSEVPDFLFRIRELHHQRRPQQTVARCAKSGLFFQRSTKRNHSTQTN